MAISNAVLEQSNGVAQMGNLVYIPLRREKKIQLDALIEIKAERPMPRGGDNGRLPGACDLFQIYGELSWRLSEYD